MKLPFKFILRNKPSKKGLYPIILRINKNRRSKIITVGLYCKKEHWDEVNEFITKEDKNHLQKNQNLIKLKAKAQKIITHYQTEGVDYTLAEFEDKFRGKEPHKITVNEFFDKKIDFLKAAGKLGAAQPSINVSSSLQKFAGRELKFRELTPEFLRQYETFLRRKGNNEGGIAFKMREIRTLLNDAIDEGLVSLDTYPFRKYKISKLVGKSRKIALSQAEWDSFLQVDLSEHPTLVNSYNYFVFSYYMRGMNFIDMMHLKWSDIRAGKIYYTRSKTKKKFAIKVTQPVQEILDFFSSRTTKSPFVFPILLKEGMSPQQVFNRKHKVLRKVNSDLQLISNLASIEENVTTYVARHSYATHMKQKGVPIEVISESLGHSNVQVTMSYLKEFEDDYLDDMNEILFKEPQELYQKASKEVFSL